MNTYFVTIVNEGCDDTVDLLKVRADNYVEAQVKALAHYNQVDDNEIDLDCAGDIRLYVVEACNMKFVFD